MVTASLVSIGIVRQGGAPSASDSADGINELNNMWNGWSVDDGLIFSVIAETITAPTSAAGQAMTAGVTRLYGANYVSAAGVRRPLNLVSREEFSKHGDLSATGAAPDDCFWDSNFGASSGTVFIYPLVSGGNLELECGTIFTTWTLNGAYNVPPAYQDALQYGLALRMISRFGEIVDAETRAYIAAQSNEAQARLRQMNTANRRAPLPQGLNPAQAQAAVTQPQK